MKKIVGQYCDNHILKILCNNLDLTYTKSFIDSLENALNTLKLINIAAYEDFINHKLKAKKNNDFDTHMLISSLCELSIINSFITQSDKKESFIYEPKLRNDNNKNVEFSIIINNIKYNIEVKSPNFDNYNKIMNENLDKKGFVMKSEARLLSLDALSSLEILPSPDSKVKDFLQDANLKFPINTDKDKELNILFICWNENYFQPCTALKHPASGLLTTNSWYKDENNEIIKFPNIDLIFISDLYKSIIVHMISGNYPIHSYVSGIPYFEDNSNHRFLTPFLLPFSRTLLIDHKNSIKEKYIEQLPIAFLDKTVEIVNEDFVSHLCPEFISTFKLNYFG